MPMNPIDWSRLKTRCRGRLPYWEIPGMTVFLTFRQADSLPQPVLDAYLAERRIVDRALLRNPDDEALHRERARVTHGWKSTTGHAAVREFGQAAPFWQSESYDHIVRHEGALKAVKRYVLDNPRKARLRDWPWVYDAEEPGGWAAGEAPAPH